MSPPIFRELLKLASVDDPIMWSQQPVLLPRVCFGKHKGLAWSELPIDYLDWIVEKSDLNEDVTTTGLTRCCSIAPSSTAPLAPRERGLFLSSVTAPASRP